MEVSSVIKYSEESKLDGSLFEFILFYFYVWI